jgi:replicative DNA helicase
MDMEKIPPHNIHAERAILGAILGYGQQALDAIGALEGDVFFVPCHREAFEAIKAVAERGVSLDPISVGEEVRSRGATGRFEGGWHDWAMTVASAAPVLQSLSASVAIVRDKFGLRKLLELASDILASAQAEDQSFEDLLGRARGGVADLEILGKSGGPVKLADHMGDAIDTIEKRMNGEEDFIRTGVATVDYVISGLRPGNMIVVAARPGVGKTSFLDCIGRNAAMQSIPTLLFSLEMTLQELTERILSIESKIANTTLQFPKGDPRRSKSGLDVDGWRKLQTAAGRAAEYPIWVDDRTLRIGQIVGEARRWHAREVKGKKIKRALIGIDYAQIVGTDSEAKKEMRERQVALISGACKWLAKSLLCPVVMLSQLNRACEKDDRRPMLSDLRESGAIEQDADTILFVHRNMKPDDPATLRSPHDGEIIIGKNRGGMTGVADARYLPETMEWVARETNQADYDGPDTKPNWQDGDNR